MILYGIKGQFPPLVDPKIARDYIYIKDVENAFLLLARQGRGKTGEVYNLGTGIQTSLEEVVNVARDVFNLSVVPRWGTMPNREWDTTVWKANNTRITALGWQAEFTFEQGFRQTVDWFQSNPEIMKHYRDAMLR
jgi:nucleoside-diphosphate-sugar epimerase